jgi:hypothetical protein
MILYSSVATRAVAGASGRGALGLVEVFRVGCMVEVFGVGYAVVVGIVVSKCGEDLFARVSNSSWAVVVACCECIRQ